MTHSPRHHTARTLAVFIMVIALLTLVHTAEEEVVRPTVAQGRMPAASAAAPRTPATQPHIAAPATTAPVGAPRTVPVSIPVAAATPTTPAAIIPPVPVSRPSFDRASGITRAALVNILCLSRGEGTIRPISGSGVIIDPRGIILTNAHVAQYVLLSQDPRINLSCAIRNGSPASAQWIARTLYLPPVWVSEHASEINTEHAVGTGEHDYALLRIIGSADGSPAALPVHSVPIDVREGAALAGDTVLVAAYPAEYIGDANIARALYPISSVSQVGQLLTFDTGTVDAFSIGSVLEAQSGSSGGPVVSTEGALIGIITTTSEGATPAQRTLRAVTMSAIDRDLQAQTGISLAQFLGGDIGAIQTKFDTLLAPRIIEHYIKILEK